MSEKKLSFQEAMKQKLAEKKQNDPKVPTGLRGPQQNPRPNQATPPPHTHTTRPRRYTPPAQ
jgi:hypothetical protein